MQRNHLNQDNDRIASNGGYNNLNRGFENNQHPARHRDEDRFGAASGDRSYSAYSESERSYGYDDNRFTDYQGNRSYGSGGYGYRGGEERHPHDEHERGRWGSDYEGSRGHRYAGGMIDDDDRYRRSEARSAYRDHDRPHRAQYQDHDQHGRFNDTGEGRSMDPRRGAYDDYRGRGHYDQRAREYNESRGHRGDHGRYGSDDVRRYGHPGYGYEQQNGAYGGSSYSRDDRSGYSYGRDDRNGYRGSDHDMRGPHGYDHDRRWVGGGYEEDRRGRGRGRY